MSENRTALRAALCSHNIRIRLRGAFQDQGWKTAAQVHAVDELWSRTRERIAVTGIERKTGQFTVYNFEIEEFHSYFAGSDQVLAHNRCVTDVIRTFRSRLFTFGGNKFLLDKKAMEHFLTRHHPDYWDGSVKSVQTFFKGPFLARQTALDIWEKAGYLRILCPPDHCAPDEPALR